MSARRYGIGVVGCGTISDIYLSNLSRRFPDVHLAACADIVPGRAAAKAATYGIHARGVGELLDSDDVDIVVNLTVPLVHAEVSIRALEAGKHVYSEKPLAALRADGRRILDRAASSGLVLGGAPDTFLGAGIRACRELVASGAIGEIAGGSASMLCPGHEGWHPDPAFYYEPGGGPVLDMGPYYLTALVELLGPVAGVSAMERRSGSDRIVGSGRRRGERIPVRVATHAAALLRFASGPIVNLSMSFDVQSHRMPCIELWGSEGSLAVPDPNTFDGPVLLRRRGESAWEEQTLSAEWRDNSRGLGVADMAAALAEGRPPRASGVLCFHVLDAMEGIHDAAVSGRETDLTASASALAAERGR